MLRTEPLEFSGNSKGGAPLGAKGAERDYEAWRSLQKWGGFPKMGGPQFI